MLTLKGFTCFEGMMPKSHSPFSIVRMQELTLSIGLELFTRGMRILTIALITVVKTAIWSRCPHELRHRFGQHTQVLLAFFELLLGSLLLIDVSAGANPVQNRALGIALRHASDQKPARRSAGAVLQAMFHFIGHPCLDGGLPRLPYSLSVITMHTR